MKVASEQRRTAHRQQSQIRVAAADIFLFCFLAIKVTGCDTCCAGAELITVFEFGHDRMINWHKLRQEVRLSSHTQLVQPVSKSTNTAAEVPL